jgi:hypothetical protein
MQQQQPQPRPQHQQQQQQQQQLDEMMGAMLLSDLGASDAAFVTAFGRYLKHDPDDDYVVELVDVWQWLGFSSFSDAGRCARTRLEDDMLPLYNGSRAFLTVAAFKSLCDAANTPMARRTMERFEGLEAAYRRRYASVAPPSSPMNTLDGGSVGRQRSIETMAVDAREDAVEAREDAVEAREDAVAMREKSVAVAEFASRRGTAVALVPHLKSRTFVVPLRHVWPWLEFASLERARTFVAAHHDEWLVDDEWLTVDGLARMWDWSGRASADV